MLKAALSAQQNHLGRAEHDFYPTSAEVTRALVPEIADFPATILDPACGDGAIALELERGGFTVVGTDIVQRGYGEGGIDFLTESAAAHRRHRHQSAVRQAGVPICRAHPGARGAVHRAAAKRKLLAREGARRAVRSPLAGCDFAVDMAAGLCRIRPPLFQLHLDGVAPRRAGSTRSTSGLRGPRTMWSSLT